MGSHTLTSGRLISKLGEEHGDVKELLIDPGTGQVIMVIISTGGLLGIGASEKILPWQAVQLNANTNNFELLVDRETFDVSPVLSRQDLGDRTALMAFYDYYGYAPYWQNKAAGAVVDSKDPSYQNAEDNSHQTYEGSHQEAHDTLAKDGNNKMAEEMDLDKVRGEKLPVGERDNFSEKIDIAKMKRSDERL